MGSFEDALTYALGANELFDVNGRNEYVETIIAKCIDFYIQQSVAYLDNPTEAKPVDKRLEAIVNRMIQRCLDDGQYRQALGIALETRRMDIFKMAILKSDDVNGMLAYAFQVAMSLMQNRGFRNTVLRCLVTLYRSLATPDYVNMCQCLIFLEDPLAVAEILDKLTIDGELNILMGYQIAFDLYESATQQFLSQVLQALRSTAPIPAALPSTYKPQGANQSAENTTDESTPSATENTATSTTESTSLLEESSAERSLESLNAFEKSHQQNIEKLINILSGEVSIDIQLQFLIRSNHADLQILRATKEAVRVSICHTATVNNYYFSQAT